nr:unnamed protein product [Callosobruchus analis]
MLTLTIMQRVAATELMAHNRRPKKFYNKIKEAQTLCTEVKGLAFDYFKNIFIIGKKDLMRCAHSSLNDYIMKHISSEINELDLFSDSTNKLLHLSNKGAYKDPVSVNEKKIADIKEVMRHIQSGTLELYYHVTSWKTTNTENDG